jgi:hypothetical protein
MTAIEQWDKFLLTLDQASPALVEQRREHIDRWRAAQWSRIKFELARDYQLAVPEGLEPHWTAPGAAVFYQAQIVRQRVDGEIREETLGWEPVNPLPANNSFQIAYRLGKGLRLRPDVVVETVETAEPSVQDEPTVEHNYTCKRHEKDMFGFPTWKAYRQHCLIRREPVMPPFPRGLHLHIRKYIWYCLSHNAGWREHQKRLALHHTKLHRGMKLEQLKVDKDANKSSVRGVKRSAPAAVGAG